MDDVKTRGVSLLWDKPGGCPDFGLGGIRHGGGVTSVQARVRNLGTPMRREKSKWAAPTRMSVPKRGTGAEQSVVGMKAL
jgi:hypothetical protein